MKVLIVFNDYLAAGGERQSVQTEVRALKRAGVDVRLLRVTNERLAEVGRAGRIRAIAGDDAVRRDVTHALRQFKPDLVHAENLFPLLGRIVPEVLAEREIPWVRTLRNYRKGCLAGTFILRGQPCRACSGGAIKWAGVTRSCYRDSIAESAGAAAFSVLDRRAERSFPPVRYIAVSNAMVAGLRPDLMPHVPIDVIHNAVEAVSIPAQPQLDREFDACFVGRLEAEKGIAYVLTMVGRMPDRKFAIVGTGRAAADVSNAARESPNLTWLGSLSVEESRAVMANSRVTLVPSQWDEPFGRVAAEAMSVGSFPLVSNRGGLPEVVDGLPLVALVTGPGEDSWVERLSLVLDSSEHADDRARLSSQAIASWVERLSPDSLAIALIRTYRAALGIASGGTNQVP